MRETISPSWEGDFEIVNMRGLHARASAKFVKCVEAFEADVTVTKDEQTVCGLSIMGLMMLGAGIGSFIHVHTHGTQGQEAFEALRLLVASGFGEED